MRWVSLAAALSIGVAVLPAPVRAEISFLTRTDLSIASAPTAFAVWRQGTRLVVADDEGLSMYRLEQDRLALAERLPGATFVKSLAVGDLNGDGTPDLVSTDGSHPVVHVYYGRADGSFGDPITVDVPSRVRIVKVAPLRHGSPAGLVLVHDDAVTILKREDRNRFHITGRVEAPTIADVAFVDADDDGSLDLVLVDEAANHLIIATSMRDQAGDGKQDITVPTIGTPRQVVVADVDGDGRGDLLTVGAQGLAVHRWTGPMKFSKPEWVWRTPHVTGVAVGDINGDGRVDLLAANRSRGTVTVFRGKGDGTFVRYESYATGRAPGDLVLTDVTHDGIADALVLNNLDHSITLLRGHENGAFDGSPVVLTDSDDLAAIAVADFNVDGRADLAVVSETDGTLAVLLGDGAGHFTQEWSQPVGRSPRALVAGNFDGDGLPDVALANFGSDNVAILLGNGRGGFEVPTLIPVGFGPTSIVSGSFQNDHLVDLAVANMLSDSASVLFNDGRGHFRDVVNYPVVPRPTYLMVGDLNHDGHPDLVAGSDYSETVTVLSGDGRSLGNPQPNRLGGTARPLVSDDFDGDGLLDLVAANTQSNSLDVLPGIASGSFGNRLEFAVGAHPNGAATGDFNGDGRPDVAVVHREAGTVVILLNTTRPAPRASASRVANGHP